MTDGPTKSDWQRLSTQVEEVARGKKVEYDPRISLNTIVVCLTILGGGLAVLDRFSDMVKRDAVTQHEVANLKESMIEAKAQRVADRNEVIQELRLISNKVDALGFKK